MDRLPTEIAAHVREVSQGLHAQLEPRYAGASGNCFFSPQRVHPTALPSVEPRPIRAPLPAALRPVYGKYADDVEFTAVGRGDIGDWVFLSEKEIVRRWEARRAAGQTRAVDVAVRYAGMGWVRVLAYDPTGDQVFVEWDGGSNGLDREHNLARRNAEDVGARHDGRSFDVWWAEVTGASEKPPAV